MKFETSARFDGDVERLTKGEQQLFMRVLQQRFIPACDRYAADPSSRWPAGLRVKPVQSKLGILEMTWSFSGPDGRATFEFVTVDGQLRVRWRRVGGHDIFGQP